MTAEKAFRGDIWTHGGPQSRQHMRALRTLLEIWQRHVRTDSWITPQHRERVQEVVRNAHASLDDGTSAYEVALLVLAPTFAATGEEQVFEVELPDDGDAATTLLQVLLERTAGTHMGDLEVSQ